jgi:hypothetical protein
MVSEKRMWEVKKGALEKQRKTERAAQAQIKG